MIDGNFALALIIFAAIAFVCSLIRMVAKKILNEEDVDEDNQNEVC